MAKICAICGEDCSDRPRVKDRTGRYYCKPCEAKAAVAAGVAAAAPAATTSATIPTPDETYDLIEIDEPHVAGEKACPVCMLKISADAVVCVHCGYDERKGIQSSTLVEGKRTADGRVTLPCAKCGYDLTGLHAPVCPECGTIVGTTHRERIDSTVSREVARREYTKPIVMFVAGTLATLGYYALIGRPLAVAPSLIVTAIALPVGMIVLWLCCLGWIGFNAPFHLNALRLVGMYAVVAFLLVATSWLPYRFIWIGVCGMLYAWLMAEMMDMDRSDAAIISLLTFIAVLVLSLVALRYFS